MNAHLASVSGPWPGPAEKPGPSGENDGHDSDHPANGRGDGDRVRDVTEIARAMGDTRRLTAITGALLAAGIAGAALVVSALLRHGHAVAWTSAALLVPVLLGWLTAAALLIMTEQPAAVVLGELRRGTGAPADLSAPWRSVGVRPLSDLAAEWERVVTLLGAADIAHRRARGALAAAVAATAGFGLWAAISLAVAAVF